MSMCSVDLCDRVSHSRGLCNYHYNLYRSTGVIKTRKYGKNPEKCITGECNRAPVARGLCAEHYARFRKHGNNMDKSKIRESHGLMSLPEYQIWKSMKGRCNNPNDRFYHRYGGRGISVCREWTDSFNAFLRDMGARPSNLFQIDRIDNDGNYDSKNCRWVSCAENVRNNSHTKLNIKSASKIKEMISSGINIADIARTFSVSSGAIFAIKRGETWRDA